MSNEYKDWLREEELEQENTAIEVYEEFLKTPRDKLFTWREFAIYMFKAGINYNWQKDNQDDYD